MEYIKYGNTEYAGFPAGKHYMKTKSTEHLAGPFVSIKHPIQYAQSPASMHCSITAKQNKHV